MNKQKTRSRLFWIVLTLCLVLSAGQLSATSANVIPSSLVINEFMAANGNGLVDEDGDHSDWIEIYNQGDLPVNLAGWALSNDPNQPQQWPFPDVTLGSQEYLVVFASGKNRRMVQPGAALHTNFKLGKDGDFLALHSVLEGRFMDVVSADNQPYPPQFRDVSYGRYGDEQTFGFLQNPTPGGPNDETLAWVGAVAPVDFSRERGFYSDPFTVELTTATPETSIYYTTDGSEPTQNNGQLYTKPLEINSTTTLRAVAIKPNLLPSGVETQTYIFLNDVLTQTNTPAGFPDTWGSRLQTSEEGITTAAPVKANYGLEPGSNSAAVKSALQALPSLSLAMDIQSFADIHTHPQERGRDAERPVSIEYIQTTGQPGFHVNAGIRPYVTAQAGASPKRSFKLYFRGEYGTTKLNYPLYPDSSVTVYDSLILKAVDDAQTQLRSEWMRDAQIDMSTIGTHGRFVHLYINGLYWGVYNVVENPDETFITSYLGGAEDEWFIANSQGVQTGGQSRQANTLTYLFSSLTAPSPLGSSQEQPEQMPDTYTQLASYLEPVQFSDFVILNGYAHSLEWPQHNWYAAMYMPEARRQGRFFIGDERSAIDNFDASAANLSNTNLKMLVKAFMQNPDFQMQFIDRLYKHLSNNGALTDENAQARWQEFSSTLEQVRVADAARWGDTLPNNDSTTAAALKGNAERLIETAREAGFYPNIDPPLFSHPGGLVEAGITLEISAPACKDCTIYYTTNGADPRLPVTGEVNPGAMVYGGDPLVLKTNTTIKARARNSKANLPWSALHQATFNVVKNDQKLRITEVMYNPDGGDDYEFIELQNIGSSNLNLANFTLDDGIRFTFPPNALLLAPGEYAVIVSNPDAFAQRYPNVPISGSYEGHLSNKGETILLLNAQGETIIKIDYDDEYGWPISPDGRGDSLTLVDPSGNPGSPKSWRASSRLHGSPGAADPAVADLLTQQ